MLRDYVAICVGVWCSIIIRIIKIHNAAYVLCSILIKVAFLI